MTNHDRYARVFARQSGQIFTTKEIRRMMRAEFPDFNIGSNRPNDHGEGNACPCFCARNRTNRPIFNRLGIGVYEVR
jgi:hypothetical protein